LACDEWSGKWNNTEWPEKLSPTYCDSTKTFTFLFDQIEDTAISPYYQEDPEEYMLIAYVEKCDDLLVPFRLGAKFEGLASPQFINDDICKYEFDRQTNLCFKLETELKEGNTINLVRLYSFTIAAWKLCYILDCLAHNRDLINLRKGFRYVYSGRWYRSCKRPKRRIGNIK
ncbi:8398_t:CDS:2, partial [Cetraspora pellucida]